MLIDHIKKTFVCAVSAEENFALAVKNKFLKIKSHSFGDTEIFCVLGDYHFHLFTHPEEMINGIAACENHSCILLDLYFLFSEFLGGDRFKTDEGLKDQLYIVFA